MGEFARAQYEVDDKPREACGVFGIRLHEGGRDVAEATYLALVAEQHRGQDGAGIGVLEPDGTITVIKDVGLVDEVFYGEHKLAGFSEQSRTALGHVRYSTMNTIDPFEATQPGYGRHFAMSHNGHIVNYDEIVRSEGAEPKDYPTDSHFMLARAERAYRSISAEARAAGLLENDSDFSRIRIEALKTAVHDLVGAYSLVVMTQHELIGMRDPNGFRPLLLGEIPGEGWVLASEVGALSMNGAALIQDVPPGQMVIIDDSGPRFEQIVEPEKVSQQMCIFEPTYFSREDNVVEGKRVQLSRENMGRELAKLDEVLIDDLVAKYGKDQVVVVGVPQSGLAAADGYSWESHLRRVNALVKNTYIGRSFIELSPKARALAIRLKLNPIPEHINGNVLVVVDDSIIRGSVTRDLAQMLYELGAVEVHLRSTADTYVNPCVYGMDTADETLLLARNNAHEQMVQKIGVTSLRFLGYRAMARACGEQEGHSIFCTACMSGNYPTHVPIDFPKIIRR